VNADSRQLYRGLDIGTAKIRPEEMEGVPHHLLDVLDPREPVSIAWYQKEAGAVIDAIRARGNIPMMVGGSMLYISSVIDGLKPLPSDPNLRAALEREADERGLPSLHEELAGLDPESAAAIPMENRVYILRALELCRMTGHPASSIKKRSSSPLDCCMLGLQRPREELTRAIEQRTRMLLQRGWVEEVQGLIAQGYTDKDPGMRSHGYREIFASLAQHHGDVEAVKTDTALIDRIDAVTRQYAKRQVVWWKRDERVLWV
jgi:tRNA dimethylallyltransferase